MHGGAVTLARQFLESKVRPDVIVATDMLDLTTFLSLTRPYTATIPVALYFHENQFAYPWSEQDRDVAQQRDKHYGFINYASALAADALYFNSAYNRDSFLNALPAFLKHFPDHNELGSISKIADKSKVLPLGLDLERFDAFHQERATDVPLVLWNHRWEHDKNPQDFFAALQIVKQRGIHFNLALLGENFRNVPQEFLEAQQRYGERMLQFGYARSFEEYARWLWRSDVLPVTSRHDFFGVSVAEALYCNCWPLLPKRLAYPELVDPSKHADCFYETFEDLVEDLADVLRNPRQRSFRDSVERFAWSVQAPRYDEEFARLVESH